jgi:DUF1016 N-terminal domain
MEVLKDIRQIIAEARLHTSRSINHALMLMYWQIGRVIIEEEQRGEGRADYGKKLVKELSLTLSSEYGPGYSSTNLWLMRQFYQAFPILHALRGELSWTHYKVLLRLHESDKRDFYTVPNTIKDRMLYL